MNKTHRIKVLGLLGLPLLAIALAVMVFTWGSSADTTEAAVDGAAASMRIDAGQQTDCPETKVNGEVCVGLGAKFDVIVSADAIDTTNGYVGAQAWITYGASGLVCKGATILWPDAEPATAVPTLTGGDTGNACFIGVLTALTFPPPSFHKGDIFSFSFNCTTAASQHKLILEPEGGPKAGSGGTGFADENLVVTPAQGPNLFVNCVPGPTNTPTSTPPTVPKMSKLPALQNVFLTRQSAGKIPPVVCNTGTNVGGLAETLSSVIDTIDPKGDPQQLAAFEFEVHYDNKKVCVEITTGAEFEAAGAVCIIEDSVTKAQLEGVARIGCVTVGKGHAIDSLIAVAQVDVRPQPDVYSQAKPNQDNGVVVQINNVNCDLGDEQGHAIPIFSCDDADITYRYLEGDVEPDCAIDAIDAQSIAFRWGVEKGSLIYKDFMNLEPSGAQADNDIDINDLQFVYGRFGSACGAEHPPQPPVNPKA